jgi:7-cyano-7-deazaguanine synthase
MTTMETDRSVLLLSGGLDSTALATWLRPALCLTISYGQAAAEAEARASSEICELLSLEHEVLEIDCTAMGAGTLASSPRSEHSSWDEFWPYRNQMLVTFAAGIALKRDLRRVLVGSIATDDRHVDGSARFYDAISALTSMQEGGVEVIAPAISLTCHELIARANPADEILARTHSCHASTFACGTCAGCVKRSGALRASGRLQ